jgi:hypothetical protein
MADNNPVIINPAPASPGVDVYALVSVSRWPPTDLADWSACCSGLVRAG